MLLISVLVWKQVQSERDQACRVARIALKDIREPHMVLRAAAVISVALIAEVE